MTRGSVGSAVAVGLITLFAMDALAQPQDKAQQRCINALNKSLERVWSAAAKNVSTCIKWGTTENLPPGVPDMESCISMDVKGRVARAVSSAMKAEASSCTTAPDFGATDAATLAAAAVGDAVEMYHDVFGADLDASLWTNSTFKEAASCHRSLASLFAKCASVRLKEFNKCKKSGLRSAGGQPPAIQSEVELSAECLTVGGDPSTAQPDPRFKIAKLCYSLGILVDDDNIEKVLDRCQNRNGVPTSVAVPGCDALPTATRICIRDSIACRACKSMVATDALSRDCDLFDNGTVDGSCPP